MDQFLMTEKEVCEVLRLGRSTLRRLMAEGAINPVHVGRALRFPAGEVRRFVEALQQTNGGHLDK